MTGRPLISYNIAMETIAQSTTMARQPGRPKSDKPRKTTLQVPLDEPDVKAIRAHAKRSNSTTAEVLRKWIKAGLASIQKQ